MATKKPENKGTESGFAVIATGGKQYKVRTGDILKIEKIKGDWKIGDKMSFDKVLLLENGSDTKIGTPNIAGAKVEAELKEIGRDRKIMVVHYKPKSKYFKKYGHRQPYFKVSIEKINA